MTEPTIVCPNCKSEIKITESLAAPLIEATKRIKVGPTDREAQPDMGAVITKQHRDRVLELIEAGVKEGAKIPADGRGVKVSEAPNGFYVGATILDRVERGMTVA